MVFPVVMYGCENWTIKQAECWRIDALELWCWRRLLRVPWTARKSNQSILKEINPEYSLEGLKLKLQYFGYLMWRADSLEKNHYAGKDWGQEEKRASEDEMAGWQWTWTWAKFGRWWGTGRPGVLQSMWSQRVQRDWATEQQQLLNNFGWSRECWFPHILTLLLGTTKQGRNKEKQSRLMDR